MRVYEFKRCEADCEDGSPCRNMAEGRTNYCAHHNRLFRKAEETARKDTEKLLKKLSTPKKVYKAPRKVSVKQRDRNQEYAKVREQFLLNKWCAYHGHGCIPTEVHHGAGKIGDLLTDTRYFVAVCREAHRMIEERPNWAKENGYSFTRLDK